MRCYPEIHCDKFDTTVAVVEDCLGKGGLDGKGSYENKPTLEGPCPHYGGFCEDPEGLPAFLCRFEDR